MPSDMNMDTSDDFSAINEFFGDAAWAPPTASSFHANEDTSALETERMY